MSDFRKEQERNLMRAIESIRNGSATNGGIADARDRLRDYARNEATAIELGRQNNELRARVAELESALAKREAVAVPDLWSFLRDVLRQGAAIESQQGQQGYETFIAHIEAEACRQEKKLSAMIPTVPSGYAMLSQSMPPEFELWLSKEMPPLTMIDNASWWAPRIWRAALRTGAVPIAASQQAAKPRKTNRQAHEEAAGMGLIDSFFSINGIDPDAEYVEQQAAKGEGT